MTPESKQAVQELAASHRLTPSETALVMEKLERAASSPSALLELQKEAWAGPSRGGASAVLKVAVLGLESEANGEANPWGVDNEDDEDGRQRAEALALIAGAERSGDADRARRIREAITASDAEAREAEEREAARVQAADLAARSKAEIDAITGKRTAGDDAE